MNRMVIALMAVAAAASCSGKSTEMTLQVISPHPQSIQNEFGGAFEDYYRERTGYECKVVWRDMGGTSDDLRFIKSEFVKRPQGIDLDVFFGGGNDPYMQLKELDVLERYQVPSEILSGIPADISGVPLYDPDYTWYGTAISGFGVMYNKELLGRLGVQEPKRWEDLADPKLFTWVGAGDPRHSGTVHMMYEIILQAHGWRKGWEIICAIGGNTRQFVQNAGDIARAVAAGQVAAGGAIDFYAWTQIDRVGADKVGFAMPEGLSVINTDSIAILKGAPHADRAKMFVDFVLSEEGQKLWYLQAGMQGGPKKESLFRMPVRRELYDKYGAQSPVKGNPFTWGAGLKYDAALGTKRYEALNDLIGATVVDTHELLVEAWQMAVETETTRAAMSAMGQPPVTEEELNEFAEKVAPDAVARNNRIAEWVEAAKKRYRSAARR